MCVLIGKLITPEDMFSRGAGFVYIKLLYSHVGAKNSIWYLINDELIKLL